jgi:hypothetical protein
MPVPTYSVKIGWNSAQAGLLVFDFSAFQTISPLTVTNKELTSNVATLTVPGHSFTTSDTIGVAGVDATFNGTYRVSATTATTVSYAKTAGNVASTASSGTVGVVRTTDVFGNAYFAFFNGTYDDVTEDVQSIRIRRGRDDILSQMNAGTAEIEMMRPSDRAYWNPANKSSLLNSANAPGFVPMRPIRIQATDPASGTTYGLFWGFIRSARFDYATGICRLSCTDLMLVLSRVNPLDPALATTEGGTGSDSYTPDAGTATDADQSTTAAKSRSGFVRLA